MPVTTHLLSLEKQRFATGKGHDQKNSKNNSIKVLSICVPVLRFKEGERVIEQMRFLKPCDVKPWLPQIESAKLLLKAQNKEFKVNGVIEYGPLTNRVQAQQSWGDIPSLFE